MNCPPGKLPSGELAPIKSPPGRLPQVNYIQHRCSIPYLFEYVIKLCQTPNFEVLFVCLFEGCVYSNKYDGFCLLERQTLKIEKHTYLRDVFCIISVILQPSPTTKNPIKKGKKYPTFPNQKVNVLYQCVHRCHKLLFINLLYYFDFFFLLKSIDLTIPILCNLSNSFCLKF